MDDRLRRSLEVTFGAVALVLLIAGSLLLFKSLANLQKVDPGVRVDDILTMSANLPHSSYPTGESANRFYRRLIERLRAIPGVEAAALSTDLPLAGVDQGEGLSVPGRDGGVGVQYKRVDPGYFGTLGIPVQSGRGIEERDAAGRPSVVLVNEELAARLLDELEMDDPVGRTVEISTPNYENSDGSVESYQIVGVARTERTEEPASAQDPVVYVPLAQSPHMGLRIVVRTAAAANGIMPSLREAIRKIDPSLPVGNVRTMEQIRDSSLTGARQPTWIIGAFALAAALLAALGLYGVLSHAVTQQRREIGIRMALGAQSTDILSRTLASASGMLGAGLVLGLAGALALTRVIESLLFEVSALDPAALGAACLATVLVGLAAGLVPARRAAKVQPMAVLREEG